MLEPQIQEAYEAGTREQQRIERAAEQLGMTVAYYEAYGPISARYLSGPLWAAYMAGRAGSELPRRARGWRYGAIPQGGRSRNYRDDYSEAGVSMMHVEGDDWEPTGVAVWFADRARVEVEGWLVTHARGSDGEPLLVLE